MNNCTNELNTLTNITEEANMNNSKNELMTLSKKTEVNMMNLFDDVALKEVKSPFDWTLADCKEMLTVDQVIFKESKKDNKIVVSVRLQGLTMLKVNKNKTTMTIPSGSFTKEEVLERIKSCDEMILEAKERLLASLKKAKTSRETTYKRIPKEGRPSRETTYKRIPKEERTELSEVEQHSQESSQPCCSE
jgi:hypothetical protein